MTQWLISWSVLIEVSEVLTRKWNYYLLVGRLLTEIYKMVRLCYSIAFVRSPLLQNLLLFSAWQSTLILVPQVSPTMRYSKQRLNNHRAVSLIRQILLFMPYLIHTRLSTPWLPSRSRKCLNHAPHRSQAHLHLHGNLFLLFLTPHSAVSTSAFFTPSVVMSLSLSATRCLALFHMWVGLPRRYRLNRQALAMKWNITFAWKTRTARLVNLMWNQLWPKQ